MHDEIFSQLENDLGKGRVTKNTDLFQYVTLHTKTTAEYFYIAKNRDELISVTMLASKLDIPLFFLGGGSNFAITKTYIQGLIVKNMYERKELLSDQNGVVEMLVSSGYLVPKLVSETIELGYEGLEYHKGLPGTVGGAIYMNSKWTRPLQYFSDSLIYAYIFGKDNNIRKVDKSYFKFTYDYSILHKTHEMILEAIFHFKKTDPLILKHRAQEAFLYRQKTQPGGVLTSGCFFKNISEKTKNEKNLPTTSSGYLIDQCGLKGYSIGGFSISTVHANFIINAGNGSPKDLAKLIGIIKKKVKITYGIMLEEEVVLI